MNDIKPQLEMHEHILNKYKKLLLENNDYDKKIIQENNNNRQQSNDTKYNVINIEVLKL